jgi:hypothetical protein
VRAPARCASDERRSSPSSLPSSPSPSRAALSFIYITVALDMLALGVMVLVAGAPYLLAARVTRLDSGRGIRGDGRLAR